MRTFCILLALTACSTTSSSAPIGGDAANDAADGTSDADSTPTPTPIAKPRGVFASAGAMDQAVVAHAECHGVLVRVPWSAIEPSPGAFDLTPITSQLTRIRAAGKQWSLAVLGGPSAPSWLYAPPHDIPQLAIVFRGNPATVPMFWHPELQTRLQVLSQALASSFATDAGLGLVYLPQMTANGIEGHFNGTSNDSLIAQGFSEGLWVQAVLDAAQTFAASFPTKPIAIELHDLLGSANTGMQIMTAIEADPSLLEQIGVAIWWLSGKSTYQTELLAAMGTFGGEVYAQVIDRAADSASFESNDYTTVFTQARELGIRYVEPWEVDLKSGSWDALFHDFNGYAAAP